MNEEVLYQVILATIEGEKCLGDNLKQMCIEYLNKIAGKEKCR